MHPLSIIVGVVTGFIATSMTQGAIDAEEKTLAKAVPSGENEPSEPKKEQKADESIDENSTD